MAKKKLNNNVLVEDSFDWYNNVKIICIVISLFAILYLFTMLITGKFRKTSPDVAKDEIQYKKILYGTVFNQEELEYKVVFYDSKNDEDLELFNLLDSKNEVYIVDINDGLNKKVVSDTLNQNPTTASEIKVKEETLFSINDKHIVEVIVGKQNIIDYLNK